MRPTNGFGEQLMQSDQLGLRPKLGKKGKSIELKLVNLHKESICQAEPWSLARVSRASRQPEAKMLIRDFFFRIPISCISNATNSALFLSFPATHLRLFVSVRARLQWICHRSLALSLSLSL
jgi:hypothetical protein